MRYEVIAVCLQRRRIDENPQVGIVSQLITIGGVDRLVAGQELHRPFAIAIRQIDIEPRCGLGQNRRWVDLVEREADHLKDSDLEK